MTTKAFDLALLTVLVLFLGYSDLYVFYFKFGIDIREFINTTDLIKPFLPIAILFSILIASIYPVFRYSPPSEVKSQIKFNTKIYLGVIAGAISVLALMITINLNSPLISFILSLIPMIIVMRLIIDSDSLVNQGLDLTLLILTVLLIPSIVYFELYMGQRILKSNKTPHLTFMYHELRYDTSDTLINIGATTEYFFLYNKIDSTTLVFERSEMSNISIKKAVGF